jgi:hypothetical protein
MLHLEETVKNNWLHILLLCAMGFSLGSCTQARYGHLTSRTAHKESKAVEKNQIAHIQSQLQLHLPSKELKLNTQNSKVILHLDYIEFNQNHLQAKPEDEPKNFINIQGEEDIMLTEKVKKKPVSIHGIGNFLGALVLLSLVSLVMAGIAFLFGMAFWKAFAISLVFLILLYLYAEE